MLKLSSFGYIHSQMEATVELRWLELVGPVGASSTHPCVRAIPNLTIFKLVHVNFMSSRTPRFFRPKLQSARDTRHWSIILCTQELKWLAACVFKVTTFISMRLCAGWSMHLLSSKLYHLSSSGWMFLFMCRYSLCSVVYRFLSNYKRKKNKFVSYYLFTMCEWKNERLPRMFTTKTRIRLYRRTIWCLSLSSQECFTPFDTWNLDYKTSHNCL